MTRAIVHIGMPKTGTTALQALLSQNQGRLEELGISYPDFTRSPNHLELAVYAVQPDDHGSLRLLGLRSPDDHEDFRAQFAKVFRARTRSGDWVFTTEHLASRLTTSDAVSRFAELLAHFDQVDIVVYVRPQDSMAVASYSTWVKDGDPRDFAIEDHVGHRDRYDFRRVISRWDDVFSASNVDVRLYPFDALLDDFVLRLGGDPTQWEHPEQRENASMDSKELAFIREMNRRLPRWVDGRPSKQYADLTPALRGTGRGDRLRLPDADRRVILDAYAESNAWVMERASNAGQFPDYFSFRPGSDQGGNLDAEITVDDALHFARLLWVRGSFLDKRLRALREEETSNASVPGGDEQQPPLGRTVGGVRWPSG